MTFRSLTAAALVAGIAAIAATPTLAAEHEQTPESIARQYESLALPTDTYVVDVEHGARAHHSFNAWGHAYTAD